MIQHLGEDGSSTIGMCNFQDLTQLEIDPMTHNIDLISHTRDKVSVLLKSVRKNSFLDAQYIAQILVHIFLDLLPSNQSMTTVIAEFLDQDQYNKPLIGWIMYKVSVYIFIFNLRSSYFMILGVNFVITMLYLTKILHSSK